MDPYDQILYDYAMQHVGLPYAWGGDDPMAGFDCSGFVIELLKSVGVLPNRYDSSAHDLFLHLESKAVGTSAPRFGAIAFFGSGITKRLTHVGFCIDRYRMLEAGAGGKHIKTVQDAIKYNACIRIRPVKMRSDLQAILKPDYAPIGVIR